MLTVHLGFDGVDIPLPSRSFARSSIPPTPQSLQPKAGPAGLDPGAEGSGLDAQHPDPEHGSGGLAQAGHDNADAPRPLPDLDPGVAIAVTPSPHTTVSPAVESDRSASPRPSATPTTSQPLLPGIPRPSPLSLIPPPPVATLPVIPRAPAPPIRIPSPGSTSAAVRLPLPASPWSLAPPITILSPVTTHSSPRSNILTTPESEPQQPSPAGGSGGQPDVDMPAGAGQSPGALGAMKEIQELPHLAIIDVDTTPTTDILDDGEVTFPEPSTTLTVDSTVTVAEVQGVPEPSTPPALTVQVPRHLRSTRALPGKQQPVLIETSDLRPDKEAMLSNGRRRPPQSEKLSNGRHARQRPQEATDGLGSDGGSATPIIGDGHIRRRPAAILAIPYGSSLTSTVYSTRFSHIPVCALHPGPPRIL
ncbi:hypothetical protein PAXRUDRAFT_20906 [Paxillus rubicundulus Ve08.2h10]|uniref:Uncharacterized protein n=1 Tax=Paxillus rubicundulus Ve08.2h10 TaxID=930991 RepID=A0A0D0CRH8_9AGAM|nr:hypothetical protein PAXRUDRAFT_20906 [Paxillus rubicundulus Ve08.2h10]